MSTRLTINGETHDLDVDPTTPLVDVLHEALHLTGTKFCCGIGSCRACTVLLRRTETAPPVPCLSCSTPLGAVAEMTVETVEGLAGPDGISELQQAFLDGYAFQCGYCTPGFLMASQILLDRLREAPVSDEQVPVVVDQAIGRHLCRCTGYVKYHQALIALIRRTPGLVSP